MNKRIILAGGSGFLGSALVRHFQALKWDVVVLTRHPKPQADSVVGQASGVSSAASDVHAPEDRQEVCPITKIAAREVAWDGETVGDWARELEGADAIVNLCGKSVDCRYTTKNRKLLIESRALPTRVVGRAIAQCKVPPRVWLNSSSATLYKHTFDTPMDETGAVGATPEAKDEFSIEIIRQWERALNEVQTPCTRKVALRTTMILGLSRNSVVPVLLRLTRLGLGGRMGSGRQFVSWMHEADFVRAVAWIIAREDLGGPINMAAPNPLPNAEMMRTFRELCGVPIGLPATEWMLEIGAFFLRTETELILKSRRVVPGRLLASGFEFRFPQFRGALEELVGKKRR